MKNLKLRTKLYFLGALSILFVVFCVFFFSRSMNRMQEKAIGYIEQELSEPEMEIGMEEISGELRDFAVKRTKLFLGIALICLAVLIIFLIWIRMHTANESRRTGEALKKIAKGDFLEPAGGVLQENCGELTDIMKETRKSLSAVCSEIKRAAGGAASSIEGAGSLHVKVNAELADVSGRMEQMISSMKQTAEVMGELVALSSEMEKVVLHLISRSNEGSEWADDIRERAEAAKESAEEKREMVRQNKKGYKESLRRELKDTKLAEQIPALSDSVMKTLERVNLLSLNASVEAAKAGIAGKEYAIVTDEIRILTEQSMKTIENIQWVADETIAAASHLNNDMERMVEFLDTELYSACNYFVRMADSYISDAGEMKFISSGFHEKSEELLKNTKQLMDITGQISAAVDGNESAAAGTAEATARIAARVNYMMKELKKAEHAVRLLNKGTDQFHVAE